jgi:hypothetical protein
MAHDVFISHSAQNREVADAVCAALEKAGIRCWVAPRDVRPGRSFPGEITRAIQQSKVMLLIFSGHSNNSEQVLREVQLATDSRLPLVRFRIEDVALTDDLRYFLSTPHWLDALTPPLSTHIARLEVAIKELLGQSVEVTGKNVVDEPVQPKVSPVAPPAATPAPAAAVPARPPPLPVDSTAQKRAETSPPSYPKPEREVVAQKSSTPWILLAIAAIVLFVGVVGVIFLLARQPGGSKQQASTAPAQTAQAPEAKPSPAATPVRAAKVTQKPAPRAVQLPKPTPSAETEQSSDSDNASAFERAGTLNRPAKKKNSAFDRAGSLGGSDEPKTEPSPDED